MRLMTTYWTVENDRNGMNKRDRIVSRNEHDDRRPYSDKTLLVLLAQGVSCS
jgi:hypothetical protein